jgi:hypothetical protein
MSEVRVEAGDNRWARAERGPNSLDTLPLYPLTLAHPGTTRPVRSLCSEGDNPSRRTFV